MDSTPDSTMDDTYTIKAFYIIRDMDLILRMALVVLLLSYAPVLPGLVLVFLLLVAPPTVVPVLGIAIGVIYIYLATQPKN
jgi:hypothetical protein